MPANAGDTAAIPGQPGTDGFPAGPGAADEQRRREAEEEALTRPDPENAETEANEDPEGSEEEGDGSDTASRRSRRKR
jgi:hypothetical protein